MFYFGIGIGYCFLEGEELVINILKMFLVIMKCLFYSNRYYLIDESIIFMC